MYGAGVAPNFALAAPYLLIVAVPLERQVQRTSRHKQTGK